MVDWNLVLQQNFFLKNPCPLMDTFIYSFNNTFGNLDTNYIIFRHVEIFTHKKLQMKKMPKETY